MLRLAFPLLALILAVCVFAPAGEALPQDSASDENAAFFSGTVAELSSDKITVLRTILGKSPETRTFLINAGTRVEGEPRVRSRVTVRFAESETGELVAVSIVVRGGKRK